MKAKRRLLLVASAVALAVSVRLLFSLRHVQLYKVTVLPTSGWSMAINDRGQVAMVIRPARKSHLFLWDRDSGMKDLGPMHVENFDINNAGQIAGTITDPYDNSQAFFWDPNDGKRMLGTFGGNESSALALNNNGQVVGFSNSSNGRRQPFIWDKANRMRTLTPDERQRGGAKAINDAGQVIGGIGTEIGDAPPSWSACYWDSTDPLATPVMAGLSSDHYPPSGFDINNNGDVLATQRRRPKRGPWLCLWRKDAKLKWLLRLDYVDLIAFNDANQVLYTEYHDSPLARLSRKYFQSHTMHCLWDPKHGKIQLDSQVPSDVGKLCGVVDINNHGCIVGVIRSANQGRELSVLFEPMPERWGK